MKTRFTPHRTKFARWASFAILVLLMFTCAPEPEAIKLPSDLPPVTEKKNPFSVEVFNKAYANLVARSSGRIKSTQPPPYSHYYVRFQPQSLNETMQIDYLGYDLWDEPLDQEIDYQGDYYHQPGLPDTLNYYYTLIPANYQIPPDLPGTVLSQVVLFDEDAGDEQDIEEDPWIPNPECPDPNNPNCPCYEGPCARQAGSYTPEKPEDMVKKTTKYLLEAGVNLTELYNEMMKLTGYDDEVIPVDGAGRTQSTRYYPAGYIKVQDNTINQDVPVKFTFVKARRFFKISETYTNASGYFNINKGFRNKAQIIVKFKNNWAKIRGVNHALNPFEWSHAVKVKLGLFEKNAMQNVHHVFQYSPNAESRSAMQFTAAHVINTIHDINQFCAANGINTIPANLNIWVTTSNWFRSSTAPMLKQVLEPELRTTFVNLILNPPTTLGSALLQYLKIAVLNYVPDVVITINNDSQSGPAKMAVEVVGTAFHELGHAVHYNKVGRNYWKDVIMQYISNYLNTGKPYGNKNNLTAVVESWGFFIGSAFTDVKYSAIGGTIANGIATANRNFLENQIPGNTSPAQWIPFGAPHDLRDVGEPAFTGVIDNASGYTINGIFRGYNSSSKTVQGLKQNILIENNSSQAAQVNQLVTSYGW